MYNTVVGVTIKQKKGKKMKRFWIISVLLGCLIMPMTGCVSSGGYQDWQQNIPQLKDDIFMFSKLATRVALTEANMPAGDVILLKGYLVALRDILSVPGRPNFTGARALVGLKLPGKYQVYGMTIIDLLERYINTASLNVTDDQEAVIALISSGIDGALAAVQEFAGN